MTSSQRKDTLVSPAKSHVVTDCMYVSETGKFPRRLKEHQRNVNKKNVTVNALAKHMEAHNHNIDCDNATIIAKEKNATNRLLVESLVIQAT